MWQRILTGIFCLVACVAAAQDDVAPPPSIEVLISVADQKLVLLRDGGVIAKYPVSTSRYGMGDSWGSYKTPVGKLRVYDKIGDDLSPGAVIKHRSATGEVLAPNAPGRDPIVTRVIWLEGTEEQNANARGRGIYIHGTPMENTIGEPVSWGCIRMRSEDVIALYNQIPVGTEVEILADRLPHLHKYKPPQPDDGDQPSLTGFLAKLVPGKNVKQASTPPQPEQAQAGLLSNLTAKKDANQAAAQPAQTQTSTGEPAPSGLLASLVVKKDAKPASSQPPPVAEKPAPVKIASRLPPPHFAPEPVSHESNGEETPKSNNPDAIRAMKGSVLFAGLPPSTPKTPPQVAEQTTQTPK